MSAVLAPIKGLSIMDVSKHFASSESKAMRLARANAERLGYQRCTTAYDSFLLVHLDRDAGDMERKLASPTPQYGFYVLPGVALSRLTAEVHFSLDAEGDIDAIEVWANGLDLWPVMSVDAEETVRRQIIKALPDLKRQAKFEAEEDRAANAREASPCA